MPRAVLSSLFFAPLCAAARSTNHDDVPLKGGGSGGVTTPNGGSVPDGSSAKTDGSTEKQGSARDDPPGPRRDGDTVAAPLTVTSPAFAAGASLPKVHSRDGAGRSIMAHDDELSAYASSLATLPSASDPTSPNAVDAIVQANETAAGSIVGKYTRE